MSFKILSDEFINGYKKRVSPIDEGIGELVFYRSYSRIKPDGKNEEYYEVVERVVNGLYHIKYKHCQEYNIEWNETEERKEAEEMYDRIFNVKFLPGGRVIFSLGSPLTEKKGLYTTLFNCSAVSTKNIDKEFSKPFKFCMDLSMNGAGVGFDTEGAGKIEIHKPNKKNKKTYVIGDTREGWVDAFGILLDQYFMPDQDYEDFEYSMIRKQGEKLNHFGGTSSGPEILQEVFNDIRELLEKNVGNKINSRMIVDIMNLICRAVIAGNMRRSAGIAIGRSDDSEFIELKDYQKNPYRQKFGWLSNNSVKAKLGMDYSEIVKEIPIQGEPGLLWLDNMQKYSRMNGIEDDKDKTAELVNPCGEITLNSYELCNLTEIFINRQSDYKDFERTAKLAYKFAKIISLCKTHWHEINENMEENRRLGISLTGIVNFVDEHGIEKLRQYTTKGYQVIRELDKEYSEKLRVKESKKVTCIKPSGSISLLVPNTTPGVTYPLARYYKRRVRVSSTATKMIESMRKKGYEIEDAINEPNTKIIVFTIDNHCNRTLEKGVSMWEQLMLVSYLQEWWADNQVSTTIMYTPEEIQELKPAIELFQYKLKGVTFMMNAGYNKEANQQLPYEPITKDEYESRIRNIKEGKIEIEEQDQQEELYCTSESCNLIEYRKRMKKHVIIMNAVTGSGKSFICDKINSYFNNKNIKSIVISKDQFRYTDKGYIYDAAYEKIVSQKYKAALDEALNLKSKNKYVILDNTHISQEKIESTLAFIKKYNTDYVFVSIKPHNDVQVHLDRNIHNIPECAIISQIEDYNTTLQIPYMRIFINHEENKINYTTEQINKLIQELVEYFK